MIRRLVLTLGLLVASAGAAELTLEQGTASSGKPATLNVTIAEAKELTGIQFDLEFDPAAFNVSAEAGPVAQQASKSVRSAEIKPGKVRVLIIGFNRNTISDGVIAVVHATYKGSETGKTFPIHVAAAAGTNADARPIAVTAKDGGVKVEK